MGRFSAGIISYADAERDLCMLKSRILGLENKSDKKKLIHANRNHIKELSKIRIAQIESANAPTAKHKRTSIRIDINDTVYGPENIGARSTRPVNVSHMPVGLAPFTVLLEVSDIHTYRISSSKCKLWYTPPFKERCTSGPTFGYRTPPL